MSGIILALLRRLILIDTLVTLLRGGGASGEIGGASAASIAFFSCSTRRPSLLRIAESVGKSACVSAAAGLMDSPWRWCARMSMAAVLSFLSVAASWWPTDS